MPERILPMADSMTPHTRASPPPRRSRSANLRPPGFAGRPAVIALVIAAGASLGTLEADRSSAFGRGGSRPHQPITATVTADLPIAPIETPTPVPLPLEMPLRLCPAAPVVLLLEDRIPGRPPEVDILFVFDATFSMGPVIQEMRFRAANLLTQVGHLLPGARFGLATFRDYPFLPYGREGDWAWRLDQQLDHNAELTLRAIETVDVNRGLNDPEAYARALYEASAPDSDVAWRDGARQLVVLLGDSVPHDDDLNEGLPYPQPRYPGARFTTGQPPLFRDPGRSGDEGHNRDLSDDIDFQLVLTQMRELDITLISVHSENIRVAGEAAFPVAYWQHWASLTGPGGMAIELTRPPDVAEVVLDLIHAITQSIERLEVRARPEEYESWISPSPPAIAQLTVPTSGTTVTFTVDLLAPVGAEPGTHQFDLVLTGDGMEYTRYPISLALESACVPTATATPTASDTPPATDTGTPTPTFEPTATPFDSPTPSVTATVPTATETPSATATATASPTATATPTPIPRPAYLPALLLRHCEARQRFADVVLVLDASSSMFFATRDGGPPKIRAAIAAAELLIGRLAETDQAGLVTFHSQARVAAPLSLDRAPVVAALRATALEPGTRIDLGLEFAHAELVGPRGRAGQQPVVVLLTDGVPTAGATNADVVARARLLSSAGARIFAIGLGSDVDPDLLRAVASTPDYMFLAPQSDDLEAIYDRIAEALPCDVSR